MSTTAASSAKSVSGVLEDKKENGSLTETQMRMAGASEAPVSPRVSTVGSDEPSGPKKEQYAVNNGHHDFTAPGLDSLHWAGVKKRGDFDARSIASSVNVERDDKSIYEEPAVGAVEEAEDEYDDDDDNHNSDAASHRQTRDATNGNGMVHMTAPPQPEPSLAPSGSFTVTDTQASIHNIEEDGSVRRGGDSIPQGSMTDTENDPSFMDDVALHNERELGSVPNNRISSRPVDVIPPGSSAAASSGATSPRSPATMPASPLSPVSAAEGVMMMGNVAGSPSSEGTSPGVRRGLKKDSGSSGRHLGSYQSSLMRKVTGTNAYSEPASPATSVAASAGASEQPSLPESIVGGKATSSVDKRSSDDVQALAGVEIGVDKIDNKPDNKVSANSDEVNVSDVVNRMETLEVDQPPPMSAVAASASNMAPSLPSSSTFNPTNPQSTNGLKPSVVDMGPEWESTFKGLLYMDSVDALGRPIVVLNADAVPSNMKSSALTYVKTHLEPMVNAGHYVIVFTARKAKLPTFWIMGAYQSLPRPYRKNVQYVVLVRPNWFLKSVLAFMRPFVSKKAARKIVLVDNLIEIGAMTSGEVTVGHLGEKFLEDDAIVERQMAGTGGP